MDSRRWPCGLRFGVTVLALSGAVLGVASCTDERLPPPRLRVSGADHELGHVRQGSVLAQDFTIRNEGGQALKIERVRVGCGCTATAKPQVLAAGAEAVIEARCETTYEDGPVKRTVTLYSSDPDSPFVTLAMSATVEADAVAKPAKVYAGLVRPGQELARETRVHASRPLGAPLPGGTVVEATFLPGAAAGRTSSEGRLRLRIKDGAPPGRFSEIVTLPALGGTEPLLRIPVSGIVGDGEAAG